MNREELLDKAITEAKEAKDWQLVEWLRLARGGASAARWYTQKFDKLKAENDKLRDELDQWHNLTAGINLPEHPITQFKPKDLERENTKLRELVKDMYESMHISCQFEHAIPVGTMAHVKNRAIGLGIEVEE